jgi:RNA polymerase sigma factor (TIGR02999 family)
MAMSDQEQNKPADGKPVDLGNLTPTMYGDLRRIGGGMMKDERVGHTLTPTALVNEAIGDMLQHGQRTFNDRAHLLATAALNMRRRLVDHARARGRTKRGGDRGKVTWDDVSASIATTRDPDILLSLDEAIERISRDDPRHGKLLQLRLFSEMTQEEIAHVLGVSLSSIEKDWRFVRRRVGELLGIVDGGEQGSKQP